MNCHPDGDASGGQWVVVEEAAAAANPDLDEIVIKQELDANGKSYLLPDFLY